MNETATAKMGFWARARNPEERHPLIDQLEKFLKTQSEFLDIASHQLRTPVSVIRGIISMIQDGDMVRLPKAKQAAFIDSAAQKGAKLDQIIANQQSIMADLAAMKEQIRILTVRVTQQQ